MRNMIFLAAAAILMAPAQAQTPPAPEPGPTTRPIHTAYADTGKTCDGWPRAAIGMAPGFCAGIVAAPPADYNARILKMPRVPLGRQAD